MTCNRPVGPAGREERARERAAEHSIQFSQGRRVHSGLLDCSVGRVGPALAQVSQATASKTRAGRATKRTRANNKSQVAVYRLAFGQIFALHIQTVELPRELRSGRSCESKSSSSSSSLPPPPPPSYRSILFHTYRRYRGAEKETETEGSR